MKTTVKKEAPETGLSAADSNLPNQTVTGTQDGDALTEQQEGISALGVIDTDTASEYLRNIYKSMDEDKELSAFSVDNPNIYNVVKKMLTIAVTELSNEDDDSDDSDDNAGVVVPEVIVAEADGTQASPETPEVLPAAETQTGTMTPVVKPRPFEQAAAAQNTAAPKEQKIDRYAVPPRAVSNSAKPTGSDDAFTASEIHNFYKDVVRGRYKGREKEADALEARIFRAVKEGRVTA
ncbi:MAG: hypothetical protein HQK99_15590 [Nitrospirae bacterium]|nr:hypothetical protein [Nitrospirota bacterium]